MGVKWGWGGGGVGEIGLLPPFLSLFYFYKPSVGAKIAKSIILVCEVFFINFI